MTRLPPTLSRWEESLAGIDPALAVALGPMLRTLDEMVGRLDEVDGQAGDPDGYDGWINRGDPGRLLATEWLLAQEVPEEFLRRAAQNELSYLRRAHRRAAPRGRVIAVCDCGPDQLGAGRLVQLATIVVLHHRAREAGAELSVVIGQGDETAEGSLAEILPRWARARSARALTHDQLLTALDSATTGDDRVWLLGGPTARSMLPSRRRSVTSWVTGWDTAGAAEVTVRVGDSTTRLALPDAATAVAALRGEGLLSRGIGTVIGTVAATGRGAAFTATDARLLWRGELEDELYGCFVAHGGAPRVKRYRMGGSVLAAASIGKRVVAAVTDKHRVWVRVVGKSLAHTHRMETTLAAIGLDEDSLRALLERPLQPLYLRGGQIVLPAANAWWALDHEVGVSPLGAGVFFAPGAALDSPRVANMWTGTWHVEPFGAISGRVAAGPLFGPTTHVGSWCTWSSDTRVWQVARGKHVVNEIGVGEGERVIGLCVVGAEPALVAVSPGGHLLRSITPNHVKTWTRWSGAAQFGVHPFRPWIVRTTPDRIVVGDIGTGESLLDIRTDQ